MLKQITPEEADRLVAAGAVLVDVRQPYEQAMERIPGAIERPLSRLAEGQPADLPDGRAPVLSFSSGARTARTAAAPAGLAEGPASALAGGIMAWKQAGYPTSRG